MQGPPSQTAPGRSLSVRASLAPGLSHPAALARKRGPPPSQPVPARRALPAASGSGLPGATAALRSQQSGVARRRPGGPFQSALRQCDAVLGRPLPSGRMQVGRALPRYLPTLACPEAPLKPALFP